MKKKLTKLLTLAMCGVVGLSCIGCGQVGQKSDAGDKVVQFYAWDSGFGVEWIKEIVNEYNALNTGYTVEFESHANMPTVVGTLESGTSNVYDLYLTGLQSWTGTISTMADLSDVVNATYGNEGVTIGSKMSQKLIQKHTVDGKITALGVGKTAEGLFYNADIFDRAGVTEIPNTTEELFNVTWDIQSANIKTSGGTVIRPWVHWSDANNGYWKYVYEVWAAQAMGVEGYEDFIQLKNENGINQQNVYLGKDKDGVDMKESDPRYEILSYLESILTVNSVHARSSEFDLAGAQAAFVAGETAMMINGSWLKNEANMGDTVNNFKFMRTPVYSGIVEDLEYRKGSAYMTDAMLSKIIKAIDEDKTYEETKTAIADDTLSLNDYNTIKTFRGMTYGTIGECGQIVFAPNYSKSLDATKDFLKYFYSDAGAQAWMDHLHTPFAVELIDETLVDKSGWDEWDKSIAEVLEDQTYGLGGDLNASRVLVTNAKDMFANVSIILALTAPLPEDRLNADGIYASMRKMINDNWTNWSK